MRKLNWGILSTAKIGTEKVAPGMLKSSDFNVRAISSRNLSNAEKAAKKLGIPVAYGSYEEIISDPEIDIIYNPLPNHLHVEWTAKAIKAGKHVLCEKPFFLNSKDAAEVIKLRDKHQVKVGEAFMVHSNPQWSKAKEIVDSGELGDIRLFNAIFSYFNTDPKNIRNIADYGGGALWDIGCYPIMTSRYLFGENPVKVFAETKKDEKFHTDIFTTCILHFGDDKRAVFSVSTQLAAYQRVHILGTKKEMEMQIPFNSPNDRPNIIKINSADILNENLKKVEIDQCDQYQLQAEAFTNAVTNDLPAPVSLEDAYDHSRIIEALFESAKTGSWINI